MKSTREQLDEMLDRLGELYLMAERYSDYDKEYEEQKEKILSIFDELLNKEKK